MPSESSITTHFSPRPGVAEHVFPVGPPRGWLNVSEDPESRIQYDEDNGDGDTDDAQKAIEDLRSHATAAIAIEFTTIPLYLYATWSIRSDQGGPGTKAKYCLLGIVQQEMLHLSLAGNILRALGGEFRLYHPKHMPTYDENSVLLYDKVKLDLEAAEKRLLGTFVKIEAPYKAPKDVNLHASIDSAIKDAIYSDNTVTVASEGPADSLPEIVVRFTSQYHSIGEFYHAFENGLTVEYAKHSEILSNNPKAQFGPDDFFGSDMTVIHDLDTAKQALSKIVDQGEGSGGVDDSHYHVFLGLYDKRDTWSCFPVPKNPRTEHYHTPDTEYLYRLSLAMDAAYCYLLKIIDDIWYDPAAAQDDDLRRWLVRCMHPLMMDIFPPLADILVRYPWKGGVAAPCFNFYPPGGEPLDRAGLQRAVCEELGRALATKEGQGNGMKVRLDAIKYAMEKVTPIPPKSGASAVSS